MSLVMEKRLQAEWALFCTVPENKSSAEKDTLIEFSKWFIGGVTQMGSKIGVYQQFAPNPKMVRMIPTSDLDAYTETYEDMHRLHPSILMALHILPEKESVEYEWMKSLSQRYGVIRQGVLYENALSRFDKYDLDEVFKNVTQWIARAMSKLSHDKDMKARGFDLRVGNGPTICSMSRMSVNPQFVQSSVTQVLHGEGGAAEMREESAVEVSGFPRDIGMFGVAQLFPGLSVSGVALTATGATVVFENKFHAAQAAARDQQKLDRLHTLKVRAVSEEVQNAISAC